MTEAPEWKDMADWSGLPDVYVTRAECSQEMFWRIEACSVPMAIGPEVRLICAAKHDRIVAEKDAEIAAARAKALEDAAQCCEREADRCDDAAIWGGSRTYVNNCKAAAYAMRDRANAIRVLGNAAAAALAVEKKRADDATLTAGDED